MNSGKSRRNARQAWNRGKLHEQGAGQGPLGGATEQAGKCHWRSCLPSERRLIGRRPAGAVPKESGGGSDAALHGDSYAVSRK